VIVFYILHDLYVIVQGHCYMYMVAMDTIFYNLQDKKKHVSLYLII